MTENVSGHFARNLRREVLTELRTAESTPVAYRCRQCRENCLNPRGHRIARAEVCLACYVQYLDGVRP